MVFVFPGKMMVLFDSTFVTSLFYHSEFVLAHDHLKLFKFSGSSGKPKNWCSAGKHILEGTLLHRCGTLSTENGM